MKEENAVKEPTKALVSEFRHLLQHNSDWPHYLVEIIGRWPMAFEIYKGRRFDYFIGGEAFDWMVLAERLCLSVGNLIPKDESETFLLTGQLPSSFQPFQFRHLLGVEKYRGYLNYFYGVTVEEALQLSTELEQHKRQSSNGIKYKYDYSDEAFYSLYRKPRAQLLYKFREEAGIKERGYMNLKINKEFTYWLFNYRMRTSDKAKTASDTAKGLSQLEEMGKSCGALYNPY